MKLSKNQILNYLKSLKSKNPNRRPPKLNKFKLINKQKTKRSSKKKIWYQNSMKKKKKRRNKYRVKTQKREGTEILRYYLIVRGCKNHCKIASELPHLCLQEAMRKSVRVLVKFYQLAQRLSIISTKRIQKRRNYTQAQIRIKRDQKVEITKRKWNLKSILK